MKAAKKEKKDLDDEDKAFLEKKKAGMQRPDLWLKPLMQQTNRLIAPLQRRKPRKSWPRRPAARDHW